MNSFIEKTNNFLRSNEIRVLLFLFILTLIFRTIHAVITFKSVGTTNWSDDWEYLSMGRQIADGHWSPMLDEFRYMQVGPVLPLLIAFSIKIYGNPNLPVFIYNIIITSLIVPLLFYLGKEIFNRKTGWLLAIWSIFYIDFYRYNPHLLKEPTVFFFLPLTLFLLIKAVRGNNYLIYTILSALSFAWLVHSDERYIVYFPIFALAFCLQRPFKLQQVILSVATWTGLVFLLMLPWGIHNYKVFGQVVIISPRTTTLTSKVWGNDISGMNFSKKEPSGIYCYELNRYKTFKYGEKYGIAPHEYKGFELYIRSFINFWQPAYFKASFIQHGARFQKWSFAHNVSGLLFYGIFLPFYMVGILLLLRKKYSLGLSLAFIPIIHSLLHTYMVWPLERYRSPIVFIIVMIGMYAIFNLYEKLIKRKQLNKS
jgi:hypothetical protein